MTGDGGLLRPLDLLVKDHLAGYKAPQRIEFVDPAGKVLERELGE